LDNYDVILIFTLTSRFSLEYLLLWRFIFGLIHSIFWCWR